MIDNVQAKAVMNVIAIADMNVTTVNVITLSFVVIVLVC